MKIITSTAEMTVWSKEFQAKGRTIALVPTMGFFHQGHLALMKQAADEADLVVVSLFVNPTQFGEGEDLSSYPRDFERDKELARGQGVDVLFCPEVADMYPGKGLTTVVVEQLTSGLCGASRPGHFDGVTTVVAKLFNVVLPQVAVFGQKDLQQLIVIKRMVLDLNFPIHIIAHPIVREEDGLALSSRNTYLSKYERQRALCLSQALCMAQQHIRQGGNPAQVLDLVHEKIASSSDVEIDYLVLIDDRTLGFCETIDEHAVLAMAVKVGKTRLIDNGWLLTRDK